MWKKSRIISVLMVCLTAAMFLGGCSLTKMFTDDTAEIVITTHLYFSDKVSWRNKTSKLANKEIRNALIQGYLQLSDKAGKEIDPFSEGLTEQIFANWWKIQGHISFVVNKEEQSSYAILRISKEALFAYLRQNVRSPRPGIKVCVFVEDNLRYCWEGDTENKR